MALLHSDKSVSHVPDFAFAPHASYKHPAISDPPRTIRSHVSTIDYTVSWAVWLHMTEATIHQGNTDPLGLSRELGLSRQH